MKKIGQRITGMKMIYLASTGFRFGNPVYEKDWPTYNWNENDISSVDSSRTQGLIVNLNLDSKPLKDLRKMVGVDPDKADGAKNKYIADVYIYSLYLYFELKNDPDKDRILG